MVQGHFYGIRSYSLKRFSECLRLSVAQAGKEPRALITGKGVGAAGGQCECLSQVSRF
jgi:hypothetical protein